MTIFLSDVVTSQEKEMQKTVLKQHYKFTLYHWETYYSEEVKSVAYWDENKFVYNERTWLNQSCYKEVFSLDFYDESQLKSFLKKRYPNENYVSFSTTLGHAIKDCNLHNGREWIAIVSTSTSLDTVSFKLKKSKKVNKYPKRKRSRYVQYYAASYDWLAREIKKKKIEEFIKQTSQLD